jgi:hypothetical protein
VVVSTERDQRVPELARTRVRGIVSSSRALILRTSGVPHLFTAPTSSLAVTILQHPCGLLKSLLK